MAVMVNAMITLVSITTFIVTLGVLFVLNRGKEELVAMRSRRFNPNGPTDHVVVARGDILAVGHGDVIVETELRMSRGLLVHSKYAVRVEFKDPQPPCPPCNPDEPDWLDWEFVERAHGKRHEREILLKIKWRVSCAREVMWNVFDVK